MARPKPLKVQLRSRVSDEAMKERKGTGISREDMQVELHGDADVYLPNGQLLCALRRDIVSQDAKERAREQFRWMKGRYTTDNRGAYSGYETVGGTGTRLIRQDGRISRQTRTLSKEGKVVSVDSAVIGYYGRQGGRFPFCRQSAFTSNHPERWAEVLPLIHEVDGHFANNIKDRYRIQAEFAQTVSEDFRIKGTVFSTLTVNNNVCGTVHKDAGDFKEGFGVIGCFRSGEYTGGHLCFPQYKVFVDFKDGDLLFFNPHEWHGVFPMEHVDPENQGERITTVYYLRRNLAECGCAKEEMERAREKYGEL